jgi:hypothetical protein
MELAREPDKIRGEIGETAGGLRVAWCRAVISTMVYSPDYQGKVERETVPPRQHDMSRAHKTPQDQRNKRRQYLNVGNERPLRAEAKDLTIFFNATEYVVNIVWEESSCVKHRLNKTCYRAQRHVFCVSMPIPLKHRNEQRPRGRVGNKYL